MLLSTYETVDSGPRAYERCGNCAICKSSLDGICELLTWLNIMIRGDKSLASCLLAALQRAVKVASSERTVFFK